MSRFLELVEEKKRKDAEAAAKAQAESAKQEQFTEAIPENDFNLTPEQIEVDNFISNIDVVEAYTRFGGKTRNPRVLPGQKENIKVICPNPSHADDNPSYWMNRDLNTGNCGVCGGFDVKDIAAFHFGYPVPEYKKNGDFPKLMKDIAESYGYRYERTLGGQELVWREQEQNSDNRDLRPNPDSPDSPDNSDISDKGDKADAQPLEENENHSGSDNVTDLFEGDGFEITLPTLAWKELVPGTDTFLDRYMEACRNDEAPEEYHFFNALVALGFAAGRQVTLSSKLPVYGNLFICALGKSGAGKSIAGRHLRTVLRRALPYKHSDPNSKGVENVTPASAEALIKAFSKPVSDPTDPKRIVYYASVKGLIDFNELSGLIGRANRSGNILKPVMMDFYDMNQEVRTQSQTGGKVIAENPFASCLTTSQPDALRDLLRSSDDASGFLNRWLFIGGAKKQRTIMGTGEINLDGPVEALERVLGWTASFSGGRQITWDNDALYTLQEFFNEVVYPLQDKGLGNIYGRLDLLFQKLVLLLTVNKMESVATLETVQTVIRMHTYIFTCYGIPADQMGNSLENEMTEAIIYQMKRLGGKDGVTLNAIAKSLKRRKYSKELILRNIKALIELGFVEERTNSAGTAGRPTKKYAYVA